MIELLTQLADLSPRLLYPLLGLGAALENIVPPVPADTFVFIGGVLAGRGALALHWVIGITWAANVGSALLVYELGRRHGSVFFERGWGRRLLNPRHLERVGVSYSRWGPPAILLSRFLPGLRAVVPVFAGVARQPFLPVAIPIAVASFVWYGALAWLGQTAGRELEAIWGWVTTANRVLMAVALLLFLSLVIAWFRGLRVRE